MSMPTIPGYEVTKLIGRGGMGRVYRATDQKLGRTVAVKMLVDADDPELLSRFEAEAKAVACLAHPNITRLFDFARTESGVPYCVMEYIAGGTLADMLAGRPILPKQAAQIIHTLSLAIQTAHAEGILHRDLKPANILIAGPDRSDGKPLASGSTQRISPGSLRDTPAVAMASTTGDAGTSNNIRPEMLRVSDFGLARRIAGDSHVTRTGQIVGTPSYMAPEQASGMVNRPGPGVDIYSLGAILFELLTGRPPFVGADGVETIMLLLTEDPVPPRTLQPTVPRDLETICLKCLEKKSSRRYLTAQELADDVARFLEDRPILAKPVSRFEHLMKWARRNPWKAIAGGLFTISGIAAMIGFAALQAAYADVKIANKDLETANANLIKANAEIKQTRDIAQDALEGVVDRLRDTLPDIPRATPIMMETSRDSLALHRRIYSLQPDDIDIARSYVSALYGHVLLEWLHGSQRESAATYAELQSAFDTLLPKYPDDVNLQVTHLKALLDKGTYISDRDPAELTQVDEGLKQLLKQHSTSAEVLKLASIAVKQKMSVAANAGDYDLYVALGRERVDYARRFAEAAGRSVGTREGRDIAIVWQTQAERDLATGLLINSDPTQAATVLETALKTIKAVPENGSNRASNFERGQLNFAMARVQEILQDPNAAIDYYSRALSLFVRLVQDYPDDVSYRSIMATSLIRSAALAFSQGKSQVAIEQLTTAQTQVSEILKLDTGHPEALAMKEALPNFREQIQLTLEQTAVSPTESAGDSSGDENKASVNNPM